MPRTTTHITAISGSPSARSRSTALLQIALTRLESDGATQQAVHVRDLPPAALLFADTQAPQIREAVAAIEAADLVIVATPIYKAAYSGLLKTFLDLLRQDALRGKTVLPLATGGSAAHLLALDYTLKSLPSCTSEVRIGGDTLSHESLSPRNSAAALARITRSRSGCP